MVEIIVVGSLNMDLSVNVPRIPLPGETISGGNLLTSAGGKGANQAAACARLGRQVAMVGSVGQDDFGRRMKGNLEKFGVDTSLVAEVAEAPSGTAMILVDHHAENCIVLSAGANHCVSLNAECLNRLKQAKLILLQLEINLDVVKQTISVAHDAGVPVILNPAPAIDLPAELYRQVTYLIPNETEASLLSSVEVKDEQSAAKAAMVLLERGPQAVIITLGGEGAILVTREKKQYFPAFPIQAVDTTGAGDAFIGGFASALVEGKDLETAMRMASGNGALAAMKLGAQASLPTHAELDQFLAKNASSKVN